MFMAVFKSKQFLILIKNMQEIITKLKNRSDLTQKEAFEMQEEIISGNLSKDEIIKIFKLFEQKEMMDKEFIGITQATREYKVKVLDCQAL